ncbi:HAD hydrolase-like protein [Beduinella massiliensis]|uniref:HAD hydrolase-like protein n=1 Tax=Beduinella massiliensis TaxID=1852363 RepID=UPI000C864FC1
MKPKVRHIIWDFNGTLLQDAELALSIDNRLLRQMGMEPITLEEYRTFMRNPVELFYQDLGVDLQKHDFAQINEAFLEEFDREVLRAGLMPGALESLAAARDAGYTQSILSSSYEPTLRRQAEDLGLLPFMRAVTGLEDNRGGTKEERGLHQLATLGVAPEEAVLVGDMMTDAFVASHMGCRCILVEGGHNTRRRLCQCGMPVAQDITKVLPILMEA